MSTALKVIYKFLELTTPIWVNVVLVVVYAMLAIGFYTESLDWLMIYYGCAPTSKRERMPNTLILNTTWIVYLILSVIHLFAIWAYYVEYYFIFNIVHLISFILFIVLHILTFYWSQIRTK